MKLRVFGHRGASAYRPENTLEAFELAYAMGADAIECDIVPTKDGQLVIRHEPNLLKTTDIKKHEEFASRENSFELTLAELKTLRAIERVPDHRPGSAKFNGQFEIPTLEELLNAKFLIGKSVILELKSSPINIVEEFAKAIEKSGIVDRCQVIIECFEADTLYAIRDRLGARYNYVYLMEEWDEVNAFEFDGISLDFALIRRRIDLIPMAHERGLPVYGWTARAEEAETSVEEYFHELISTGVDGIFADHPDLLRNYVDGLS